MPSQLSKAEYNNLKELIKKARYGIINTKTKGLGIYGVRKTFEWAITVLFMAHGETENSSAWHPIENLVLTKGSDGWIQFWLEIERKFPRISSTINKLNPKTAPVSHFIEDYRRDVGPEGDRVDFEVADGIRHEVSDITLMGLEKVIGAMEEKIDELRPRWF